MKIRHAVISCLMLFSISSMANANVIMNTDKESFESHGTLVYDYGFDDYSTNPDFLNLGYMLPGDNWYSHGVTYTSENNLIGYRYTSPKAKMPLRTNGTPMMMQMDPVAYWNHVNSNSSLSGKIDESGKFTLFGFDAGYVQKDPPVDIEIMTNLNNYTFHGLLWPATRASFFGFVADQGEYFTGFALSVDNWRSVICLDNVKLGIPTDEVPEPGTLFLLGTGLVGLVGAERKCRGKRSSRSGIEMQ